MATLVRLFRDRVSGADKMSNIVATVTLVSLGTLIGLIAYVVTEIKNSARDAFQHQARENHSVVSGYFRCPRCKGRLESSVYTYSLCGHRVHNRCKTSQCPVCS